VSQAVMACHASYVTHTKAAAWIAINFSSPSHLNFGAYVLCGCRFDLHRLK
jgi:hypothetical protein